MIYDPIGALGNWGAFQISWMELELKTTAVKPTTADGAIRRWESAILYTCMYAQEHSQDSNKCIIL